MRAALSSMAIALVLLCGSAAAAPEAQLWPRWLSRDDASTAHVDHAAWDRLLERHVRAGDDGINRVAYAGFSGADRFALDGYVQALGATAISRYGADEQFAFWANLYNALTVQVVLAHYPVASIRDIDISPGLFAQGPWGKKLVSVEGEPLSLDDIEHRILRPIWKDPRVHYAVNCAALGCPDLPGEAFTAQRLETQLERAARGFVNHPRAARVDGGRLRVSSIYSWFKDDFGGSDAGVIAHLKRYAAPPLRSALDAIRGVNGHDYDWRLNGAR